MGAFAIHSDSYQKKNALQKNIELNARKKEARSKKWTKKRRSNQFYSVGLVHHVSVQKTKTISRIIESLTHIFQDCMMYMKKDK